MANRFFCYLEREHARLEQTIADASAGPPLDRAELARLQNLKRAIRDQIAAWRAEMIEPA